MLVGCGCNFFEAVVNPVFPGLSTIEGDFPSFNNFAMSEEVKGVKTLRTEFAFPIMCSEVVEDQLLEEVLDAGKSEEGDTKENVNFVTILNPLSHVLGEQHLWHFDASSFIKKFSQLDDLKREGELRLHPCLLVVTFPRFFVLARKANWDGVVFSRSSWRKNGVTSKGECLYICNTALIFRRFCKTDRRGDDLIDESKGVVTVLEQGQFFFGSNNRVTQ